ncbi:sulfatase-like hydrolase/transferase [Candidatus Dojkabacteria bacterium]|uniref:Sulfatase-like hydrolase/transferase n=1 Tax=Candidatus Dojkabacteria bacterium TaxID=2099670 RepID=A0A955HYQ3_9BACT|nr:sulfatase-like hydrolase/transferase [Candidatus Dojkabacteria bacterium]
MDKDTNYVFIICDCLRVEQAYDTEIMPFLNKLKELNSSSDRAYTNAPSTHFAVPALMTGFIPFQRTRYAGINDDNSDEFLAKIFQEQGFRTYGITTNAVTSRAFGYNYGWDYFEDYWGDMKSLNEVKKGIVKSLPEPIREHIIKPIFKMLRGKVLTPVKVKEDIRGGKIVKTLEKLQLKKKTGNFIFLHFMEPHSPYIPKELSKKQQIKAVELNNKLQYQPEELNEDEIKDLKDLYIQECKDLDKCLEHVFEALKNLLEIDKTRIVITADHGEAFNETGYTEHKTDCPIDNMSHLTVPLVTVNLPLDKKNDYWSVDINRMFNPASKGFKGTERAICVGYKSLKGSSVKKKKYTTSYIFDLKNSRKIDDIASLPFKTSSSKSDEEILEDISI